MPMRVVLWGLGALILGLLVFFVNPFFLFPLIFVGRRFSVEFDDWRSEDSDPPRDTHIPI